MCQIITVILFTLFFQIIAILCLELNIYIVKQYDADSKVQNVLDFSANVDPFNTFITSAHKQDMKIDLSSQYNVTGKEVVLPAA